MFAKVCEQSEQQGAPLGADGSEEPETRSEESSGGLVASVA